MQATDVLLSENFSPTISPLPPMQSRSVTVVIPALNEEGNLEPLLAKIAKGFDQLGYKLPVLIIDDGSTDNTPVILKALSQQYSFLRVMRHAERQGVTGVWRTAIAATNTEWILWGQADLESDPETDIPLLMTACGEGIDALAGWRQQRGDGKLLASKVANLACHLTFGLKIHDMNWIKLVRRDLLMQIPIETVTHRYLLAVLAGNGYRVTEISTPWHPRFSGSSKFGRKRLLSSALDFCRTLWWFKVSQHLPKVLNGARWQAATR